MTLGALLSAVAGYGVFLVYTAVAFGWKGVGISPAPSSRRAWRARFRNGVDGLGLSDVDAAELAASMAVLLAVGSGIGYALFGSAVPTVAVGLAAAIIPIAARRARTQTRMSQARDAWPRMIEEIRLQTGSIGRSIPQALFEVGRRAPTEMRGAFAVAQREWLLSTDFARTIGVLKAHLADPTADATCETLLVAHEIGGSDLDHRLEALVEDRVRDLQGRRDAAAKQAGVRFARRFVLVVPAGMAVAGLSIGAGRQAYETALGQAAVLVGICAIAACWVWAGRLLKLPTEHRVFDA